MKAKDLAAFLLQSPEHEVSITIGFDGRLCKVEIEDVQIKTVLQKDAPYPTPHEPKNEEDKLDCIIL